MKTLRETKKTRYDETLRRIRQRWKDAKSYASSDNGVKDKRLFRAVAQSADTSTGYSIG